MYEYESMNQFSISVHVHVPHRLLNYLVRVSLLLHDVHVGFRVRSLHDICATMLESGPYVVLVPYVQDLGTDKMARGGANVSSSNLTREPEEAWGKDALLASRNQVVRRCIEELRHLHRAAGRYTTKLQGAHERMRHSSARPCHAKS